MVESDEQDETTIILTENEKATERRKNIFEAVVVYFAAVLVICCAVAGMCRYSGLPWSWGVVPFAAAGVAFTGAIWAAKIAIRNRKVGVVFAGATLALGILVLSYTVGRGEPLTGGELAVWHALEGRARTTAQLRHELDKNNDDSIRQLVKLIRDKGFPIARDTGVGYYRPDKPPE